MARQAALAAFPFGGFVNETNTSSSAIGGTQLDASSPASGTVVSQTATPASVAFTGRTANDNRTAVETGTPAGVALTGKSATGNKSQGAVATPNTVTITPPGADTEVRSGTQVGAPSSTTLTGQTASGTKGPNAVAPTTSQRQAVVIAFPNVAFLNESRTASGAVNNVYTDETPAGATTTTVTQTGVPASVVETGQAATGTKTAQQGNSGSATGQPGSVAVAGQTATGTASTTAPGTVASSRQTAVARFPMTLAFVNERGTVASGSVANSYLDETKASPKSVSQTVIPASVTATPGVATSTSATKQTIAQTAAPSAVAIVGKTATSTAQTATLILPRSRLGLGIGLTPLAYAAATPAQGQTISQTATPGSAALTGRVATGTQASGTSSSSVTLPTPAFGSANLVGWWDVNKSYTDATGATVPGMTVDTVSSPTISFVDDLSGSGNGFAANNKTNQPPVGSKGGPLFTATNYVMSGTNLSWLTGLSKFSLFFLLVPKAGASTRTILTLTEGAASVAPTGAVPAQGLGGSGYAPGDYVTASTTFVVLTVDGNGAILTLDLATPVKVSTIPTNPVAVTKAVRPNPSAPGQVNSPGTGASLNLSYPAIGSGSSGTRANFTLSSGATGRKTGGTVSPFDGTASTIPFGGTSLGAPNNAALTDTTTAHSVGMVVDMTVTPCTATFYYDGVLDHSETFTPATGSAPWALNTSPATTITLGSGLNAEMVAGAVFADAIAQSRVTQLVNSWAGY